MPDNDVQPSRLVRISGVGLELGLTTRRARQLVSEGELDFVMIGRTKYVVRDSLLEFIERRRTRASVRPDDIREKVRAIAARRRAAG